MPTGYKLFACCHYAAAAAVVLCLVQVDAGETPEAALVRELQEELSIQVGQGRATILCIHQCFRRSLQCLYMCSACGMPMH
jgi:8-oxo-dGTP pyrophosphatase MutT (NUDIX family)